MLKVGNSLQVCMEALCGPGYARFQRARLEAPHAGSVRTTGMSDAACDPKNDNLSSLAGGP